MPDVISGGVSTPLNQFLGSPDHNDKAVAVLVGFIPYVGWLFKLYVPFLGAFLVMISSNSGVFGASRIAYAMGTNGLLPAVFKVTNPKTKTPVVSILVFASVALVELVAAYFQGDQALNFLADLYAFGAALSYTLVFVALITLRFTDTAAPRPFRMPLNFKATLFGLKGSISAASIVGLLGIGAILVFIILTHPVGRIAGPLWVVSGIIGYAVYRRKLGRPVFGSMARDWVHHHEETLSHAGELEMLDEYRAALKKP
jgi:amino acid transporter